MENADAAWSDEQTHNDQEYAGEQPTADDPHDSRDYQDHSDEP
jgi:hypothetical protein